MEIKTCEEYVLAQLKDAQEQVDSLQLQIESLQLEIMSLQVELEEYRKNE